MHLQGGKDTPLRSPITTHVLDTCIGKPAPQVAVRLERKAPGSSQAWETVATGRTNVDGRVPDLLPPSDYVNPGIYRISFDTDEYMSRCKAQHPTFFADVPFYPAASVQFQITPEQVRQHFHVPLTWNPYETLTAPVPITSPIKALLHAKIAGAQVATDSPLSPPSGDEDVLAGAERLVPDPDSPTSRLLLRAARRSLREAEEFSSTPERRFSFLNDIARNPKLAAAARQELEAASGTPSPIAAAGGGGNTGKTPGSGGNGTQSNLGHSNAYSNASGVTYFQHASDVERQSVLIAQLDKDAEQESKINQGMASVMLGRLQSGKNAAERVLSVLQAFASAEAGYARAMDALSGVVLPGEADGPTLRAAMVEFSALPAALCGLHSGIAEALVPEIKNVQRVVGDLRIACNEIGLGTSSAQKSVDAARRGLKLALNAHRDACKAFDAALVERQRVGSRSRSVESDPWVAEGRLVEKQAALQEAQTHQRMYLGGAFRRAGELERNRIDVACSALAALSELPRTACMPEITAAGERLSGALDAVDAEADLDAFSAVAGNSIRNGDALSSRQAQLVEDLWMELTSSAEIVRQGEVERYDAGKDAWIRGYAVATRAGFLHWFSAAAVSDGCHGDTAEAAIGAWGLCGGPRISLNLARCEFEQGEAPAWRLIEGSSGGLNGWLGVNRQSLALKTHDVDGCMDWAADLRELIALCSSK
ncbi:putative 5-hydroxyisourate hydrolase [Nannochloris sp. 'desiccata']|nr:putative 5-hydroxyisourate hydrolase [Chlorella desiccata (nom. nud.)]